MRYRGERCKVLQRAEPAATVPQQAVRLYAPRRPGVGQLLSRPRIRFSGTKEITFIAKLIYELAMLLIFFLCSVGLFDTKKNSFF